MADAELIREVYARFGAAYYFSECLHRELCTNYALAPFSDKRAVTGPRVEERMAEAFSLTLGQLAEALSPWLPNDLRVTLAEAVSRRNYLAHHFWFDKAPMMLSDNGLLLMLDELEQHRAFFETVDERAEAVFAGQRESLGVTEDTLAAAPADVAAGKDTAPLLQSRRLRKRETIVRVWDVPVGTTGSTLVFETDDGELWQLCDVGLGSTRFEKPGLDWKPNQRLTPHLPSSIKPRPGVPGTWSYEFELKGRTLFCVTLSAKQPQSFSWTLRSWVGTEPNQAMEPTPTCSR